MGNWLFIRMVHGFEFLNQQLNSNSLKWRLVSEGVVFCLIVID